MKVLVYLRSQNTHGIEAAENYGIVKLAKMALKRGGVIGLPIAVENDTGTISHFEFVVEATFRETIDLTLIDYVKGKEISIRTGIGYATAANTKYYSLDTKELEGI